MSPSAAPHRAALPFLLAALAAANDEAESASVILDGVRRFGAAAGALLLLEGDALTLVGARGCTGAITERLARLDLSATDDPLVAVVGSGAATWWEGPLAARGPWAPSAAPLGAPGGALPLCGQGACLGVLVVGFPPGWALDEDQRQGLEILAGSCARALARLRRAAQLERRFHFDRYLLGIVGHDLRNPLMVIALSTSALARRQGDPERWAGSLQRLRSATERARVIVSDLLDYTALEAGQIPIRREPVDLFAVVKESVEEARVRAPERTLELALVGDGRASLDRARMQQVLSNLLSNALTYGRKDAPIQIRVEERLEHLKLAVTNQGPVIPPDRLADLFSPMRRGDVAGERGSVGLGLFIAQGIVTGHHGRISVRSEQSGTTFAVELPKQGPPAVELSALGVRAEAPRPPSAAARSEAHGASAGAPMAPALQALLASWHSLAGDGVVPHPARLHFARLLAYLPDMTLLAASPAEPGPVFRPSLLGAALCGDGQGEAKIDEDPELYRACCRCFSGRAPVSDRWRSAEAERPGHHERLIVPLSRTGGAAVTHLLMIVRRADQ